MIRKVSFRNFKAYRSLDTELEPLTVLVGPNASGKTTLLEGLKERKDGQGLNMAGFHPQNPEEASSLQKLRERLPVDPILKSHELDARAHGAKTDIKRALKELTQGDGDRERQCLAETELAVLEQRGEDNGLTAYLSEVRERLVLVLRGW